MARLSIAAERWRAALLAQITGAIAGGVDIVQVREHGIEDREYTSFLRACVALTRGTACRILVNDRIDLALAADAHGVHLREKSVPVAAARRLMHKKLLVGRSVHDPATAVEAITADYMIAGSVFATDSKPGEPATLGLDGLRRIVVAAGRCPVWAIGGITPECLTDVKACGVRGVAAIGAFIPPAATNVATDVRQLTEALRFSLDSSG